MADTLGEVLFEFTQVGSSIKVAAVHVETGTEAIIQGPAYLSQKTLQKNALAKLRYILEKQKKEGKAI